MLPPLIGGALSDAFVWRLSFTYIGHNSRTEKPRKTQIDTEVAHVTRDSDTTFKVKGQGHQADLVGCWSHYWSISVDHKYSWRKVAGCHRHKACMGWSWAAACGVQGWGHIARLPVRLVKNLCLLKGYIAQKLLKECPNKRWNEQKSLEATEIAETPVQLTGRGRPWTALTVKRCDLVDDLTRSGRCATDRRIGHISTCKFQGILEFVDRQLVASYMIFSEPPPTGKQHACMVVNVF